MKPYVTFAGLSILGSNLKEDSIGEISDSESDSGLCEKKI